MDEEIIFNEQKWASTWVQVTQLSGPSWIPFADANGDNISRL